MSYKLPIDPQAKPVDNHGPGPDPNPVGRRLEEYGREQREDENLDSRLTPLVDAFAHGGPGHPEPDAEQWLCAICHYPLESPEAPCTKCQPKPMPQPGPSMAKLAETMAEARREIQRVCGVPVSHLLGKDDVARCRVGTPGCTCYSSLVPGCSVQERQVMSIQRRPEEVARDLQVRRAMARFRDLKPDYWLVLPDNSLWQYNHVTTEVHHHLYPPSGQAFVYFDDFCAKYGIHPATCTCRECRPDLYPRPKRYRNIPIHEVDELP